MKSLVILSTLLALPRIAAADSYSLPWQLRPVASDNLVRVESGAAVFEDDLGNVDIAGSTLVSGSYQLTGRWAPTVRLGFVGNNAPGAALDGTAFGNPLLGMSYTARRGDLRYAVSGATTLPIGMGGGGDPATSRTAKTALASTRARPADEAIFEVDYLTAIAGVDAAYVHRGFTAQGELDLQQGLRVRGSGDDARTSAIVGLHVGYAVGRVSFGGDLRYQHRFDTDPMTSADTTTAALGVRLHARLGGARIAPGLSYTRGIDGVGLLPSITHQTTAVQIDVPVLF